VRETRAVVIPAGSPYSHGTATTETSIKIELEMWNKNERIKFYIVANNAVFGSRHGLRLHFLIHTTIKIGEMKKVDRVKKE